MANAVDRLSVRIALLGLLNDLPEQPSINASPNQLFVEAQESQSGRTLTFDHEKSITQRLAYISAYSDDPLHVLATCIEEEARRGCLIIRLAANTGTHENLVNRMTGISQILQNEAINGLLSL